MPSLNRLSEAIIYFFDNFRARRLKVKVDYFEINKTTPYVVAVYRLGRKKLLHRLPINEFENNYFESLSLFDQFRIVKFSSYNNLLLECQQKGYLTMQDIFHKLDREIKNEQLF